MSIQTTNNLVSKELNSNMLPFQTTNNLVSTESTAGAYHTLSSVNNIDQSKFEKSDAAALAKHWNKCFLQSTNAIVSSEIYNAIATQSGTTQSLVDSASILVVCLFINDIYILCVACFSNKYDLL